MGKHLANESQLEWMLRSIPLDLAATQEKMATSFPYDQFKPRKMILQISFGICGIS